MPSEIGSDSAGEHARVLSDDLEARGLVDAFDRRVADFAELTPFAGRVWIDEVKQKTFVSVDEEGTGAAAVTSVGVRTVSGRPPSASTAPSCSRSASG